jgi:hypothetical protein
MQIYSLFSKIKMKWKERAKQETTVIEREKTERPTSIFIVLVDEQCSLYNSEPCSSNSFY